MEIGGVMTYEVHDTLVERLIDEATRPPPDERYERPSLEMLARADREFFRILAEKCTHGIRRTPAGARPLEDVWDQTLAATSFNMLLVPPPLPGASEDSRGSKRKGGDEDAALKQRVRDCQWYIATFPEERASIVRVVFADDMRR